MNPADKFLIFFGLLDLFYGYPLNFGPIIHPKFFFLYMENFDSVYYKSRLSSLSQLFLEFVEHIPTLS